MTKKNKQKNSNKDIRISSSEKQFNHSELELKREWDDFRRDEILRQFRKTG